MRLPCVLVVPYVITPLHLRRVVVACKETRECRRAVRDALPFLRQAKEVLLVEIGEEGATNSSCSSTGRQPRHVTSQCPTSCS